jgi:hypothetical protein
VAVQCEARVQRVADRLVVLYHEQPRHGRERTAERPRAGPGRRLPPSCPPLTTPLPEQS